jgi:hypothetical protein
MDWLVVKPTPLKNMSSSVGMMTFPTEWTNTIHVPNHQPVEIFMGYLLLLSSFINIQDKLWEASSYNRSVEDDFGGVTIPISQGLT